MAKDEIESDFYPMRERSLTGKPGLSSHCRLVVFVAITSYLKFCCHIQGDFFHWYPPKKLKYGKPRLGGSRLT